MFSMTHVHLRDWRAQFHVYFTTSRAFKASVGVFQPRLIWFWWRSKSSVTVISARQVELLTFGQKNTVLIQLNLETAMLMRSSSI